MKRYIFAAARMCLYLTVALLLSAQTSALYLALPGEGEDAKQAYTELVTARNHYSDVMDKIRKNHELAEDAYINFNPEFTAFAVDNADRAPRPRGAMMLSSPISLGDIR